MNYKPQDIVVFQSHMLWFHVALALCCKIATVPALIYPQPSNKTLRPAPLFHTRPDFKLLTAKGGRNSWVNRDAKARLRQSLNATLGAMRRWGHDSVLLSIDKPERDAILLAAWEAGFKAGAGYKP